MTDLGNRKSTPVLLPIGSVVTLKGAEPKPLMVFSRMKRTEDGERRDYLLCPYPEGFIDEDKLFAANTEDIDQLLFIGFQNKREFEMREELNKPLEDNEGTWDWTEY